MPSCRTTTPAPGRVCTARTWSSSGTRSAWACTGTPHRGREVNYARSRKTRAVAVRPPRIRAHPRGCVRVERQPRAARAGWGDRGARRRPPPLDAARVRVSPLPLPYRAVVGLAARAAAAPAPPPDTRRAGVLRCAALDLVAGRRGGVGTAACRGGIVVARRPDDCRSDPRLPRLRGGALRRACGRRRRPAGAVLAASPLLSPLRGGRPLLRLHDPPVGLRLWDRTCAGSRWPLRGGGRVVSMRRLAGWAGYVYRLFAAVRLPWGSKK